MKSIQNFTAIIEKEDDSYVALCPELDVASQGDSIEEAKKNLQEAIELFFEHASEEEITSRLKNDFFITNMQIAIG
jgi:predicted RNase H-like HicB family nuclease